jgi:SPP1 gp7 family putative phage head morphogenesis protein
MDEQLRYLLEQRFGREWKKKLKGRKLKTPPFENSDAVSYKRTLETYAKVIKKDYAVLSQGFGGVALLEIKAKIDIINLSNQAKATSLMNNIYSEARRISKMNLKNIEEAVFNQTGIPINFTDLDIEREVITEWAEKNMNLIKKLSEDVAYKVKNGVVDGFMRGDRASKIANTIQSASEISIPRLENTARDQLNKLRSDLESYRMQKLCGLERYQWATMGDDMVRPSHIAKNGNIYKWTDAGIKPGEEINCRCQAYGVF